MLFNADWGEVPLKPGDRVEISPIYDLWMRGAMYGVVRKVVDGVVTIKMDHPQVRRLVKIPAGDVRVRRKVER